MKSLIIVTLAIISLAGIGIWFGLFNVAANEKHYSITTKFLEIVRARSVSVRSKNITVPDLDNEQLIKNGAEHYAEMCTGCHLAPGMNATEVHNGLYPKPPVFNSNEYGNNPQAQFWVIKNGLKMTGMPAWSTAHSDEEIWGMVAFVNQLKTMTSEQYKKLSMKQDGNNHSGDHDNTKATDGHSHSH